MVPPTDGIVNVGSSFYPKGKGSLQAGKYPQLKYFPEGTRLVDENFKKEFLLDRS